MSRSRIVHRFEYALYASIGVVARRVPEPLALRLGALLGWIAGPVLRIRWRDVIRHLERAFPERDPAWRRRVARGTYAHLGREVAAIFKLESLPRARVAERITCEGVELLEGPTRDGRGVILVTAHFGNWEIAIAGLSAHGIPLEVVAKKQRNPFFDRDIREKRERFGAHVVYQAQGVRATLRALREGRVVILVADQNVLGRRMFVDFFGAPAAAARGPVVLAQRSGADLVFGLSRSLPGAEARYVIRFVPIEVELAGGQADAVSVVRAYHAMLENAIREHPTQYFWLHRRWKSQPPETVGLDGQRPAGGPGGATIGIDGQEPASGGEVPGS